MVKFSESHVIDSSPSECIIQLFTILSILDKITLEFYGYCVNNVNTAQSYVLYVTVFIHWKLFITIYDIIIIKL